MSPVSSEFQPLLAQKHWWFSLPVISTCVIPDMFSTQFHLGFVSGNVLSSVLTLSCTMVTVMSIIQTRKGRLREFRHQPARGWSQSWPQSRASIRICFCLTPKPLFCSLILTLQWGTPYQVSKARGKTPVQDRQQLPECLCQPSLPPKVSVSWCTCLSWFIDTIDTILRVGPGSHIKTASLKGLETYFGNIFHFDSRLN